MGVLRSRICGNDGSIKLARAGWLRHKNRTLPQWRAFPNGMKCSGVTCEFKGAFASTFLRGEVTSEWKSKVTLGKHDLGGEEEVFYGQEPPSGESTTTECGVQLSTTSSNVLKQPNGELLVAVNHNQLRRMASETVNPIDWSHPPPSWAVPPERHVHSINQCNFSGTRTCNRSMQGPSCLCGHSVYEWPQDVRVSQLLCGHSGAVNLWVNELQSSWWTRARRHRNKLCRSVNGTSRSSSRGGGEGESWRGVVEVAAEVRLMILAR